MQAHCMLLNQTTVQILNPGQTPVDVCDCPVFALSKKLQFRYPSKYNNYVTLLGGLHLEQAILAMHGQLIDGSGLLQLIEQYHFTTIGMSSVVDVSSIKTVMYCIQVVLSALYMKLVDAMTATDCDSNLSPSDWLILLFVRSIREGNFKLYTETPQKLVCWCFARTVLTIRAG